MTELTEAIQAYTEAAHKCMEVAHRHHSLADEMQHAAVEVRRLFAETYINPEDDTDPARPRILHSEHLKDQQRMYAERLDQMVLSLYGAAGAWHAEADYHADRVTSLSAGADHV